MLVLKIKNRISLWNKFELYEWNVIIFMCKKIKIIFCFVFIFAFAFAYQKGRKRNHRDYLDPKKTKSCLLVHRTHQLARGGRASLEFCCLGGRLTKENPRRPSAFLGRPKKILEDHGSNSSCWLGCEVDLLLSIRCDN